MLATNPVFPRIAVEKRMSWGGLDPSFFDLITHGENSIWCKPNPLYYEKIVRDIQVHPVDTVMIGNDYMNDMIARHLGITTILITNHEYKGEFTDLGDSVPPNFMMTIEKFVDLIMKAFSDHE